MFLRLKGSKLLANSSGKGNKEEPTHCWLETRERGGRISSIRGWGVPGKQGKKIQQLLEVLHANPQLLLDCLDAQVKERIKEQCSWQLRDSTCSRAADLEREVVEVQLRLPEVGHFLLLRPPLVAVEDDEDDAAEEVDADQ
jgi:hypothetical protein